MVYLFQFREPFSAWSHGLWLLLSIPATFVLWRRCGGDRAKQLSLTVFGLSLAACYLGSMLYHGVRLGGGVDRLLRPARSHRDSPPDRRAVIRRSRGT